MKPKQIRVAVMAAAALIAFAAGLGMGLGLGVGLGTPAPSAPSGRAICAANPCRVIMTRNGSDGLVIKDAAGPKVENAFLIIDPTGLAEFWQNAAGAYEGPRGEICTTNSELAPAACLGGDGTAGWVRIGNEVLTSGDLAWLHQAEGATRPAVYRVNEPTSTAARQDLLPVTAAPTSLAFTDPRR
ncbi:MAG TPA: hypothetical protein VF951_09595 [Streptosporangiaceae bacterium]